MTLVVRVEDDMQSFARTYVEYLHGLVERGLRILLLPRLHAKIYWSESEAIISSLNLLSSSFISSIEVGLWSKEPVDVARIRRFINEEIEPLVLSGDEIKKRLSAYDGGDVRPAKSSRQPERLRAPVQSQGFCIRCAERIELDPERPYCWDDYQQWARYENADYPDDYCHGCGNEFKATMNKPLCRSCYRKMND